LWANCRNAEGGILKVQVTAAASGRPKRGEFADKNRIAVKGLVLSDFYLGVT
jgi:hypothetical protein